MLLLLLLLQFERVGGEEDVKVEGPVEMIRTNSPANAVTLACSVLRLDRSMVVFRPQRTRELRTYMDVGATISLVVEFLRGLEESYTNTEQSAIKSSKATDFNSDNCPEEESARKEDDSVEQLNNEY